MTMSSFWAKHHSGRRPKAFLADQQERTLPTASYVMPKEGSGRNMGIVPVGRKNQK